MANQKLSKAARAKVAARLKAQRARAAEKLRLQKQRLKARKALEMQRARAAKEKERIRRMKLKEAARAQAARDKERARKALMAARAKAAKEKERARLQIAKDKERERRAIAMLKARERAEKERARLKAAKEKQKERERIAREKAKAKEIAAREKAKARELAALEKAKAKEAAALAKQKEKELKAQLKQQAQELLKLRKAGRPRRNGDAERALLLRAESRPEDAEARRTRLKNLIKLGKERGFLTYADLNEEIGRVTWAQYVFNCQAPDAGNGEILHLYGTDGQKERWLRPLVDGDARSFFSMTEPDVSGADPTALQTTATLDGEEWVISGRKWFSSGAEGASFGIVMAVTEPDAEPRRRMSHIIVPADAPGLAIEPVPVLGHRGKGWTTHCEVTYDAGRVPRENLLGQRGAGFLIAQKRLGPGRIHHVMRWLGQMQRAFELMCTRALEREAFGGPLAEKQTVQNWIADSAAEIQACRLLTLDAARKIDADEDARVEISLLKFYAAGVLSDVIDRAIQVHGARGLTDETPLARMALNARAGRIYDGPDEVHRMVVARRILRSYAAGDRWRFS